MGISTQVFNTETFPVPDTWIFEKFLNLPEKLEGQSVSMHSIFNKNDRNPSMMVYLANDNKYRFNCFSTGTSGDGVDLIQHLYGLKTRDEAFEKAYAFWIEGDWETYETRTLIKSTFQVTDFKVRGWNTNDAAYWTQFHIGSSDLNEHYVQPLEEYTTLTTKGEEKIERVFSRDYCYGYFRKDGTLYKIYNPFVRRGKFIKVQDYIQGHDQLKFKGGWLIILASLKDLMAFKKLRFPNIECIAPDSENTMITQEQFAFYRKRYDFISVLFDNDHAGKRNSRKYFDEYQIPFTEFDVEKDLADCIKEHGIKNTRIFLQPKLLKTKSEYYDKTRKTSK